MLPVLPDLYASVCAATGENEIVLMHDISARIFTTHGQLCLVNESTASRLPRPQTAVFENGGSFGRFCLCLCSRQISFLLGSSLLLAFVYSSLVKTRLNCQLVLLAC